MARSRFGRWPSCVAVAAVLAVSACGGGASPGEPGGKLVVFAAASLTESFTELAKVYEKAHPGTDVTMSFAGSSSLSQQIIQGAPAGVFASANPRQMRLAAQAGKVAGKPTTFARNELRIAVPAGNPADVTGLAAFGKANLKIAVCAEQVPCGAAARKALDAAGVRLRADTLEQDVKAVLTKVRLGEVDAGLVYRTDVASAGDAVHGISFPTADKAVNDYRIATLSNAPNAGAAREFVQFVLSDRAQKVLARYGFETVN